METDIIVALIGFGGVVAGAFITWLFQRGKNKAEITQTITETAMGLLEPLNKRIDELEAEIKALKAKSNRYLKRIIYLMDVITKLMDQLKRHSIEPCAQPDQWNAEDD